MVKLKVQFLSYSPIDFEWNKEPLQETIEKLLTKFNFHGAASDFVLQNDATKQNFTEQDFENVLSQLSSGSLLVLKPSVSLVTKDIQALSDPKSASARRVIFELRSQLQDEDFAKAFLSPTRNGLQLIVRFTEEAQGSSLAYGLAALTEALKYSFVLDIAQQLLTPDFITRRLFGMYINNNNLNVRKGALALAALLANRPQWGFKVIDNAIRQSQVNDNPPYHNIVEQLASTDVTVQVLTLQLINNLLLSLVKNNPAEKDKDLPAALQLLDTLESLGIFKLLRRIVKDLQDENLKRQLFIFQCLRLKKYQARKEESYDKKNSVHEEMLIKLWTTLFPETPLKDRLTDQWKMLGFQGTDPATDFRGMGLLGLINLLYFAENHTQVFRKLLQLQQQRQQTGMARDYPVAVTGINLTQMLYDLFGVGKPIPLDSQQPPGKVYKVLFDSPTTFEELYCIAFQLLDRTWDEMNANYMDFPKVLSTVRNQIETVLDSQPLSMEMMSRMLLSAGGSGGSGSVSLPNMSTVGGMTAAGSGTSGVSSGGGVDPTTGLIHKTQGTSTTPGSSSSGSSTVAVPVVSVFNSQVLQDDSGEPAHLRVVKANLRKELVLLFTQHKIGLLMEGMGFMTPTGYKSSKAAKSGDEVSKIPSSGSSTAPTALFLRLNQTHNELHYGPVSSLSDKPRTLPNKVSKVDVVSIRSGPAAAQSGKAKKLDPEVQSRLLCITLKDGTNLELIAPSRSDLANWADGLRLLFGQQLEEKESYVELQKLIDIEMQVRLIDLTGITLPESQPPIPPPPLSFDFVTVSSLPVQNSSASLSSSIPSSSSQASVVLSNSLPTTTPTVGSYSNVSAFSSPPVHPGTPLSTTPTMQTPPATTPLPPLATATLTSFSTSNVRTMSSPSVSSPKVPVPPILPPPPPPIATATTNTQSTVNPISPSNILSPSSPHHSPGNSLPHSPVNVGVRSTSTSPQIQNFSSSGVAYPRPPAPTTAPPTAATSSNPSRPLVLSNTNNTRQ